MTADIFTIARQHAAITREYYEAFQEMGFTSDQAFELTKAVHQNGLEAELMTSFPLVIEEGDDD